MTQLQRPPVAGVVDGQPMVHHTTTVARPAADTAAGRAEVTTSGVPWTTVLPLAAVLAYADGFWVIAMRGAAGAIQRTQGPGGTWLRESTLALPLYVGGILLAVLVAARLVGPVIRTRRALMLGMLVIICGATAVGAGVLAASSAYDYRLQLDLIATGGAMPGMCATPACLLDQAQSSYALQLHVVWLGAVILLVTNAVVVAWMVAARGGRLELTRLRVRPLPAAGDRAALERGLADDLAVVVAVGLVGSAVIHAAVVPDHLAEWIGAGIFFVGLALAQLVLAALVVKRRTRPALVAVLVASALPLLLWVVSRGVGLPFGPAIGLPEAIGLADLASGVLELVSLVLAAVLLSPAGERDRAPLDDRTVSLVLVAMVAVTALGVGGTDLAQVTTDTGGGSTTVSHG